MDQGLGFTQGVPVPVTSLLFCDARRGPNRKRYLGSFPLKVAVLKKVLVRWTSDPVIVV